jgi:hypothetical protein
MEEIAIQHWMPRRSALRANGAALLYSAGATEPLAGLSRLYGNDQLEPDDFTLTRSCRVATE